MVSPCNLKIEICTYSEYDKNSKLFTIRNTHLLVHTKSRENMVS